jgi:hypothetical protein
MLDIPQGVHYDSVCVVAASIPISFYLIRSPSNTLYLRELGVDTLITVPQGNYTARSFATTLSALLTSNSPNLWTYTMSLNLTIAKYTYTVSGNGLDQPSIVLSSHLADQTGFDLVSTNTFVANTILSTDVINFVSTNTFYIHSNIVQGQSSVLQEIYSNNTVPFSYATWICPSVELYSKRMSTNVNNVYDFSVTDEHGNVIELNGQNVALTLSLYRKRDISEMFKNLLQGISKMLGIANSNSNE